MLGRLRQATKASLLALALLVLLAIVQLVALERGLDRWLIVLIPVVVCTATVWIYTELVMRHRVGALADAFVKMSHGHLDTELPPAPDADVASTREAFVRMSTSLRDMTDRLRQVDVLRRQLFADLAHEIGTPTATVVALADALSLPEVEASAEKRAELVEALVAEGLRLTRLIGDMRDLAALDDPDAPLQKASTDVAQVVSAVARRLELARPEAAPIVVSAPPRLLAEVDEHRVEQILVNVLTNAQRYTPSESAIEVRLEAVGPGLRITIEDGGSGVDRETLARLGERLFRADPSRSRTTGGSGLGLSIVRAIAERHGGALRFDRAARGGLLVCIELPRGEVSERSEGPPGRM